MALTTEDWIAIKYLIGKVNAEGKSYNRWCEYYIYRLRVFVTVASSNV
jgi:hypothetical protein